MTTRPSTPLSTTSEELQQDLKQNFETLRQKIEDNVSEENFEESYETILGDVTPYDINGMTLIMHAAQHDNEKIYRILAADGASINAVNSSGETALIIAANANSEKMVNALIIDIATGNYVLENDLPSPEDAKTTMKTNLANPNVQRCLNKQTAIFMAVILPEGETKDSIMSQHGINQSQVDDLQNYREELADRDKIDSKLFSRIQQLTNSITGHDATQLNPSKACTIS